MKTIQTTRLENLKKIAESYRSQREFADALDMAPAQLSHLISERRNIGEKLARRIEECEKLPFGWLDIQHNADYPSEVNGDELLISNQQRVSDRSRVPLVEFNKVMSWLEGVDGDAQNETKKSMIQVSVSVGQQTFAVRVPGDQMEPEFSDGEVIAIEPSMKAMHKDFVLARYDDEITFKQLIVDGGDSYLKPLNERYPIKPLGTGKIIGVVREKTKIYR